MYLHGQRPAELGGITHVGAIADKQRGPTCGFEAVENVIQAFYPEDNDLVETDLIERARFYDFLQRTATGPRLDVRGYKQILADYDIEARWHPFDHVLLAEAVQNDRVAIAVVDAHRLNPKAYSIPKQGHAIVVTNFISDAPRGAVSLPIVGYAGIDSNFPGVEVRWSWSAMESACRIMRRPLLITDSPAQWPHHVDHYALRNGKLVAVR
jgi:hypothetical protein